jgi:xanthine dehydrogenase FAD-binding subunit
MIPYDFSYLRPESIGEAVDAFAELDAAKKKPHYYGGGSEIITMARAGAVRVGAVIDLKAIPDCLALSMEEDALVIGCANTLNRIKQSKLFPLLGTACGRVADHTNQCRITLGGNLCGTIAYRECSLPLMLTNAHITLASPKGRRTVRFSEVFDGRMRLGVGEFAVQVRVGRAWLERPYVHVKRTTNEKIDYPLVNLTAVRADKGWRAAFAGVCEFPFRSEAMERALNETGHSVDARVGAACARLPAPARDDAEGSGEYRMFVLDAVLRNFLEGWEHGAL